MAFFLGSSAQTHEEISKTQHSHFQMNVTKAVGITLIKRLSKATMILKAK